MASIKPTPQPYRLFETCPFRDSVSCFAGSFINGSFLVAATSWDKTCKAAMIAPQGPQNVVGNITAAAPPLCIAAVPQSSMFIYGTADGSVVLWNVENGQQNVIARHNDAVTGVRYIPELSTVVSSSFDSSVQFLDVRTNTPNRMSVAGRVQALDALFPYLAVMLTNRVEMFDFRSSRFITADLLGAMGSFNTSVGQCVAIFPDKTGIVFGLNDGRVTVIHFQNKASGALPAHA